MGNGMFSPFARILRLFRPSSRVKASRAAQPAHVGLERLEERCVMAGLAGAEAPTWYSHTSDAWPIDDPAVTRQFDTTEDQTTLDPASPDLPAYPVNHADLTAAPAEGAPTGEAMARFPEESFDAESATNQTGAPQPQTTTATPKPADPSPPDRSPASPAWRVSIRLEDSTAGQPASFIITRACAPDARAEVSYTLTAFSAANAVRREGVVTIPAGASHSTVSADTELSTTAGGAEIVTLTLQAQPNEPGGPPALTVFLSQPEACSESALFEAYRQAKSPEAFDALVERHRPAVLRACHKILGSWHDAEDVSQLVFLALAQQHLRLQTTLAGWLNTVARNASIALLRSRRRRQRHEQGAARTAVARGEDSAYDQREELDAALQQVAAPLRDAVRLRYLEGWSQKEAARILGCPRGTLSQRAAQGLRYLRGILGIDGDRD